ncbi:unnamed protein product, partial [Nesidiocoris tenuis]
MRRCFSRLNLFLINRRFVCYSLRPSCSSEQFERRGTLHCRRYHLPTLAAGILLQTAGAEPSETYYLSQLSCYTMFSILREYQIMKVGRENVKDIIDLHLVNSPPLLLIQFTSRLTYRPAEERRQVEKRYIEAQLPL